MGNNKKNNRGKPFYAKEEKPDESLFEKSTENETDETILVSESLENEIETLETEPEVSEEEVEVVVNEITAKEAPETNVKKTQRFIKLTPNQHRIRTGDDVVFYKKGDIIELPLEKDAEKFFGSALKEWKRFE